jgi:hypothetical protein
LIKNLLLPQKFPVCWFRDYGVATIKVALSDLPDVVIVTYLGIGTLWGSGERDITADF